MKKDSTKSAAKQPRVLSKSKLTQGLQCQKALFLTLTQPGLAAETQAQFDEGNEVGDLAREHFGKGVLVETEYYEIDKALKITQALIHKGEKTIYEASFSDGKIYCRVDILTRSSVNGKWKVIEVKKSVDVKEDHCVDVALQALVFKRLGIKVESFSVMYLNREAVFPDLEDLFVTKDVTDEVMGRLADLEEQVEELLKLSKTKKDPKTKIGAHCDKPYTCAYREHCWSHIPDFSVFDLHGVGPVKGLKLINQGMVELKNLSAKDFKNPTQKRIIDVTKSNKRFIDKKGIDSDLAAWDYPLHFLDFETVNPAIPRYQDCSPYNQIPYQLSCHVLTKKGAKLTHFEFLHLDIKDPRKPLAKKLAEGIGPKGAVVAYNMGFEGGVIKKLADRFPKYRKTLLSIVDRLVDPLPIFRDHVYDRDFRGSFSIKDVAPALLGDKFDYSALEIGDGKSAGALADGILRGKTAAAESCAIIESLLTYSRQETLAMAELVAWLNDPSVSSSKKQSMVKI